MLTEKIGDKCQLVGDDLFVTNTQRLQGNRTGHGQFNINKGKSIEAFLKPLML